MKSDEESSLPKLLPLGRICLICVAVAAALIAFLPSDRVGRWLSLGDGHSSILFAKMCSRVAPWIAGSAFCGLVLATLFASSIRHWYARRVREFESDLDERADLRSPREAWGWLAAVVGLVLLCDGPTLIWGFFESDDFDLFQSYREQGLWRSVISTHNDHAIPLLRVETAVLYELFGAAPAAYNALYLCTFTLLLWSGCLWLREVGVSRWSTAVALLICIGWTLWGQFTSGAYILQKYQQIAACSGFLLWSYERWCKRGNLADAVTVWMCLAVSTFMNVSGFWVPCALLVFAVARRNWSSSEPPPGRRSVSGLTLGIGCGLIVGLAVAAYITIYSLPGNQRLLSQARIRPTGATVIWQEVYFLATLALSLVLPTPHHLAKLHLLWPAVSLAGFVAIGAGVRAYLHLPAKLRGALVAAGLILAGIGLMVCLGRPMAEQDYIWHPKFLGSGWFWLCLTLGLVCEGSLRAAPPAARGTLLQATALGVAICWTIHGTYNLCVTADLPFFQVDISRGGQLREHEREHAAIRELREQVCRPLEQLGLPQVVLPEVEGKALCAVFPALKFTWGEAPALSRFTDVLFARPSRVVWLDSPAAPGEVDPRVQGVLDRSDLWQRLSQPLPSAAPDG